MQQLVGGHESQGVHGAASRTGVTDWVPWAFGQRLDRQDKLNQVPDTRVGQAFYFFARVGVSVNMPLSEISV